MFIRNHEWYRKIGFGLFLFLAVQLSGLTCIQDLWAYSFSVGGSPPMVSTLGHLSSEDASPESFPSSPGQDFDHDCPCHHSVTYISCLNLESASISGELNLLWGSFPGDNFPQPIFHPPLTVS